MNSAEFYEDPFGGEGKLVSASPYKRTWHRPIPGTNSVEQCVVERVDHILDDNAERLNSSAGQRWGTGQVVASIPNAIFWHGDFAKAHAARDDKWIERFLNDIDNRKLRTFHGKL